MKPWENSDFEHGPGVLTLSSGAKKAFVDFYNEHNVETANLTGDLAAAWSKLEEIPARLSLIIQLCLCTESTEVDAPSMHTAIELTQWFKDETKRVYQILAESNLSRRRRELTEWIRNHGGETTARELTRLNSQYPDTDAARDALQELVECGLAKEKKLATGGRPKQIFSLT